MGGRTTDGLILHLLRSDHVPKKNSTLRGRLVLPVPTIPPYHTIDCEGELFPHIVLVRFLNEALRTRKFSPGSSSLPPPVVVDGSSLSADNVTSGYATTTTTTTRLGIFSLHGGRKNCQASHGRRTRNYADRVGPAVGS